MEREELLAALEAHGTEFLQSFGELDGKRKQVKANGNVKNLKRGLDEEAYDDSEWTGFESVHDGNTKYYELQPTERTNRTKDRTPQVVVFSESATKQLKTRSRNFMSSKVSKLKESSAVELSDRKSDEEEDEDHEISNLQNDALLHRLVHTKLLSGSLNPDLDMKPAQRRKALAGRILELAGDSKLGKGESAVRQHEKNRAAKRVREGMVAKQKERDKKALEEAKNTGNYHPALRKLFAASSSDSQRRKRSRGLKMGVGKFSGGILKLTPEEVSGVQGGRPGRSHVRDIGRRGKKR